jgi:hypothetical protein
MILRFQKEERGIEKEIFKDEGEFEIRIWPNSVHINLGRRDPRCIVNAYHLK